MYLYLNEEYQFPITKIEFYEEEFLQINISFFSLESIYQLANRIAFLFNENIVIKNDNSNIVFNFKNCQLDTLSRNLNNPNEKILSIKEIGNENNN